MLEDLNEQHPKPPLDVWPPLVVKPVLDLAATSALVPNSATFLY
jgi:hypothetical protein